MTGSVDEKEGEVIIKVCSEYFNSEYHQEEHK